MRVARKVCEANIYHVIVRGVGKQILFEDDADRLFYVEALATQREKHNVELYAWCLMSNHVHMVLHAPIERISKMMHALETRYAGHFNYRHARSGTLFQGRFTSVPIESEEQLKQAVRYVHRNILEANESVDSPWSSFREYAGKRGCIETDTAFVLGVFEDREGLLRFNADGGDAKETEYAGRIPLGRLSDEDALSVAKRVLGDVGPYELKTLDRPQRDALLANLRQAGLSARQIGRITSIGKNIIYRA